MKITLLSILLVILSGCATTAKHEKCLRSWVGKHSDTLISTWGPPTQEETLFGGGKFFEYSKSEKVYFPGYAYTTTKTYGGGHLGGAATDYETQIVPGRDVNLSCKIVFITNASGIIKYTRWNGNYCARFMNTHHNTNSCF